MLCDKAGAENQEGGIAEIKCLERAKATLNLGTQKTGGIGTKKVQRVLISKVRCKPRCLSQVGLYAFRMLESAYCFFSCEIHSRRIKIGDEKFRHIIKDFF